MPFRTSGNEHSCGRRIGSPVRNEGQRRLAAAAKARTQDRVAKILGCSQGFLSKVLSGHKELGDAHKAAAETELGIPRATWEQPAQEVPAERELGGEAVELPIDDRPGLALALTLGQLRAAQAKMRAATDSVEWARLARVETAALRTLAELRGDIGHGRELRLRAELEAAKAETALIASTVREALVAFPEAARAVSAALKRVGAAG